MRAVAENDQVAITLDRAEARRLVAVLAEATTIGSRSEFFIRVGCSLPNVEALVRGLADLAEGRSEQFQMPIVAGVESADNPPRPRPAR